jgi:hypothetical protein
MDMDGYGWMWMDVDGLMSLVDVDEIGRCWMMDGYGWIWMDVDGCGWIDVIGRCR